MYKKIIQFYSKNFYSIVTGPVAAYLAFRLVCFLWLACLVTLLMKLGRTWYWGRWEGSGIEGIGGRESCLYNKYMLELEFCCWNVQLPHAVALHTHHYHLPLLPSFGMTSSVFLCTMLRITVMGANPEPCYQETCWNGIMRVVALLLSKTLVCLKI